MRNFTRVGAGLALGLLVAPAVALAQATPEVDTAVDVQTFDWAIGPKTFFSVANADVSSKGQVAVDALVSYMTAPFKIYNVTIDADGTKHIGTVRDQVVDSVTSAQLTLAYGVSDKLQVGFNLPVIFSLQGNGLMPATGQGTPEGLNVAGLGDLLLEGKYSCSARATSESAASSACLSPRASAAAARSSSATTSRRAVRGSRCSTTWAACPWVPTAA